MTSGRRYHRWDNDSPDTRVRASHEATVPGWTHSVHSTFAEPSRLGDVERPVQRSRRSALLVAAGVGAAAVAGASLALLLSRRSIPD